ncbi:putative disease resistance protein At5g05400 [Elaeis guineensis]|uniref:Disease resistance protein At5g05400 n=1 Tax=Elaeis guineensis var. tenera TaxID=51953 RepID=A0A6I9RU79_ELAGV|nr:putative disease resistance protein At5g05400 [Elaeis guineensis]
MKPHYCSTIMKFGKTSWNSLELHMSYALCYHQRIENLKHHLEKLEARREDNQKKVDIATKRGEIINNEVQQWLKNFDTVHQDMRRLVDSVDDKCCRGLLPDMCFRYKLGKNAEKKMAVIKKLLSEGNFERVSHSPPPPISAPLPSTQLAEDSPPPPISGPLPSTQLAEDHSSTESTISRILDALRDDKVHIIGVYGVAGVGKTTLVNEAAMRARGEGLIDEVVMVTASQNLSMKRLQNEMAEKLGLKIDEESESAIAAALSARLKDMNKILIILDDLWDRFDLSNVGIPCGGEQKGCKVIITSRSSNVCRAMECQMVIEVGVLSEKESWDLLKKVAGNVMESPKLEEVARNIIKECGGLPQAIVTAAQAMKQKSTMLREMRRRPIPIA